MDDQSYRPAHKPISEKRKRRFLRELEITGSFAEAARRASPHCRHPLGPASSFRQLANRDPDFAEQVKAAEEAATASLEVEAVRRARDGYDRPVYQNGKLVGHERCHSDALLIQLLKARRPEMYGDKSKLELSGHLSSTSIGLTITSQDLLALDDRLRQNFEEILEVLVRARGEQPTEQPPLLVEVAPS